jgi:hypothetical protein
MNLALMIQRRRIVSRTTAGERTSYLIDPTARSRHRCIGESFLNRMVFGGTPRNGEKVHPQCGKFWLFAFSSLKSTFRLGSAPIASGYFVVTD